MTAKQFTAGQLDLNGAVTVMHPEPDRAGYYTLRSRKTGVRFTYRTRRMFNQSTTPSWAHGLLVGPDNERDYAPLAQTSGGVWTLTGRIQAAAPAARAHQWAYEHVLAAARNAAPMPDLLEVWHEGRCVRCGRKLTTPESVAAGLGPECRVRVQAESNTANFFLRACS